jgi:ubiquitin-conjugating enzyme E2 D/E
MSMFLNRDRFVRTVPSIATEYVRNRVQHDRTARRWTELYALSPASVPAPTPIVSTSTSAHVTAPTSTSIPTTSTSTTQTSGSRKDKSRAPANQSARGSGSSNILAETIDISDSDDELLRLPPTRKRPRGVSDEVDIDFVEGEQRATRRLRAGGGGSGVPSASRCSRGSGSIMGAGEVIIIDD